MIFPELCEQDQRDQVRSLEHQVNVLDAQVQNLRAQIEKLKGTRNFGFLPQSTTQLGSNLSLYSRPAPSGIQKMRPPQVVVHFLKQMDCPISQKKLKEQILNEGYPPERFGKNGVYYHVILDRLKKRGKLEREGDEVRLMA